jgi:hypothetical protein
MRRTLLPIAALYAAACVTANAQVLYSTGFEEFNIGSIVNQFGWEQQLSSSVGEAMAASWTTSPALGTSR